MKRFLTMAMSALTHQVNTESTVAVNAAVDLDSELLKQFEKLYRAYRAMELELKKCGSLSQAEIAGELGAFLCEYAPRDKQKHNQWVEWFNNKESETPNPLWVQSTPSP